MTAGIIEDNKTTEIVILDTGIDPNHVLFANGTSKIIAQIDFTDDGAFTPCNLPLALIFRLAGEES